MVQKWSTNYANSSVKNPHQIETWVLIGDSWMLAFVYNYFKYFNFNVSWSGFGIKKILSEQKISQKGTSD